jgi:phosphoribosylformylglycinamidine synthase subunit PurQ / glutaminase
MATALVIRTAGTNCDVEMCRAFELAGARVDVVHLDRVIREPGLLGGADLFGFPGGFSYGDDIASGRVFAMKVREKLYPALREALNRGALVIGACNGFQVLVQVGLLPGPDVVALAGGGGGGLVWPERVPEQCVALTDNQDGRFQDRWVAVEYPVNSRCVWTRGLGVSVETKVAVPHVLPVAHGEGRFVAASVDVINRLEREGQVAVRYKDNYNGSQGAIAGICDATGRVLGLMPHPERFLDWNRHPSWTRLPGSVRVGPTPGLSMFRNAVEAVMKVGV